MAPAVLLTESPLSKTIWFLPEPRLGRQRKSAKWPVNFENFLEQVQVLANSPKINDPNNQTGLSELGLLPSLG